MTLREKFKRLKISQKNTTATLNIDLDTAIELEQIADDYAIDFGRWLNENDGACSYAELLQIFKKEKGL